LRLDAVATPLESVRQRLIVQFELEDVGAIYLR